MNTTYMEGWLLKKKSKSSMFNNDVRRWFKIQRLEGTEDELALCYFSSNKSKDVKGWIFLSDIVEISEDKSTLTVVSPARTMTVETQTIGEHRLWTSALVKLCPSAQYNGETASKFRNNDNAEEKSSSPRGHDSKHEDKRGQDARVVRSQSREGSLDRDVRGGERAMMGPRGGKDSLSMRKNSSREDMSVESDDERRGQGGGGEQRRRRSKTHDDSSTGSNGSRGRGSRLPNTSDDHRKGGGSQSCPDASTSARMYSHISGEPDERNHRGRLPPQPARGGRSSSRDVDDEDSGRGGGGGAGGDVHRDSFELEAYDLSKASLTLSRDERLQFSKENEMRRQYDDGEEPDEKESGGHGDNDDEADGSRAPAPAPPKRRKPAPPPGGPQPRWNSPSRDGDDEKLEESPVAASRGGAGDVRADNFDSMSLDPSSKRRGVSIDELISDPALTVNLDDDSDEEEKVDFKAEKRRYAGDAKGGVNDREEGAKSRPPLAPPKVAPPPPRSAAELSRVGAGVDTNFVSDDWDNDDESAEGSPKVKASGKPGVQTGSQVDSNWLDEDFDD